MNDEEKKEVLTALDDDLQELKQNIQNIWRIF